MMWVHSKSTNMHLTLVGQMCWKTPFSSLLHLCHINLESNEAMRTDKSCDACTERKKKQSSKGVDAWGNLGAAPGQAAGSDWPRYVRLVGRPNTKPFEHAIHGPNCNPTVQANPGQFMVASNRQYGWPMWSRPSLACPQACPHMCRTYRTIYPIVLPPNGNSSEEYSKVSGPLS